MPKMSRKSNIRQKNIIKICLKRKGSVNNIFEVYIMKKNRKRNKAKSFVIFGIIILLGLFAMYMYITYNKIEISNNSYNTEKLWKKRK